MSFTDRLVQKAAIGVAVFAGLSAGAVASAGATAGPGFLSSTGAPAQVASTIPTNGDVNPYGVAVVPASEGTLVKGDTLVSNFNDKGNVQGTGTPITQISPSGVATTSSKIGPLSTKTCPARSGSRPRSPC